MSEGKVPGKGLGIAAIGLSYFQLSRAEAALEEAGFTEESMSDMFKDAMEEAANEAANN